MTGYKCLRKILREIFDAEKRELTKVFIIERQNQ
jgi:hypothetical protein